MAQTGPRFRSRGTPKPKGSVLLGVINRKVNGAWIPWNPPSPVSLIPEVPYLHREATTDELNGWPVVRKGGPFLSVKIWPPDTRVLGRGAYDTGTTVINGFVQQYVGGFLPQWPFAGDTIPGSHYMGSLFGASFVPSVSAFEPQVYPKLRPQLQSAGLGVATAEMRDLPQMLRTSSEGFHNIWKTIRSADDFRFGASVERLRRLRRGARMAPKKAADQFLNHVFGWVPFVSDYRKFCDTFVNEGEKLARLTRDNNTWIKRKWVHEESYSDTLVASGNGTRIVPWNFTMDAMCNQDSHGSGHWTVRRVVSTLVWSEGSFRYYRPEFDVSQADHSSTFSHLRRISTLYGLRVNPSVIYQATPWSWAIDWFTNVRDHIDHITDIGFDGITSRYMYLMHHQVTRLVFTQYLNFRNGPVTLEWTQFVDSKQRKGASSPYGFNLSWSNLTPRQIAIASALGVSRLGW